MAATSSSAVFKDSGAIQRQWRNFFAGRAEQSSRIQSVAKKDSVPSASAQAKGATRQSQDVKDGAVLCEALREAARRRKAGAPKDADHILVSTREAMDDRLAGDTDNFDCSRAARELEGMLMRLGR